MCLDKVWQAWGDAWTHKKPFKAQAVGIAFMLAGDTGASNIDLMPRQALLQTSG